MTRSLITRVTMGAALFGTALTAGLLAGLRRTSNADAAPFPPGPTAYPPAPSAAPVSIQPCI